MAHVDGTWIGAFRRKEEEEEDVDKTDGKNRCQILMSRLTPCTEHSQTVTCSYEMQTGQCVTSNVTYGVDVFGAS